MVKILLKSFVRSLVRLSFQLSRIYFGMLQPALIKPTEAQPWLNLRYKVYLIAIAFGFMALQSCDRDNNNPGYDYFPDMAYSRAYETYAPNPNFKDGKTLLAPDSGTVSRESENYPYGKIDSDIPKAAKMKNPFLPDTETLSRGKAVYQNVCLQCHGAKADGKGFLYVSGKYTFPPANLTSQKIVNKTDGEMYHTITVGFGIMPPHGIIVRPDDRWKVILYVRSLQKKMKNEAGN